MGLNQSTTAAGSAFLRNPFQSATADPVNMEGETSTTRSLPANYFVGTLGLFQRLDIPITSLEQGTCFAFKLQQTDPDFLRILNYVECSQEPTFGIKILAILRVAVRAHDSPLEYKDNPKVKGMKRMMLWKGIPVANLQSMLEEGPQISEGRNRLNSYGIVFHDRVGPSCYQADFEWPPEPEKEGYLLLCDVVVGESYKARNTRNLRAPPSKEKRTGGFMWGEEIEVVPCQSVLACGAFVPEPCGNVIVDDCLWPLGDTVEVNNKDTCAVHNEYTVFNTEQIRVKYLVKVEFTERPYHH